MKVAIKDFRNGEITVGTTDVCASEGETVKVDLMDENGDWINATGVVVAILED